MRNQFPTKISTELLPILYYTQASLFTGAILTLLLRAYSAKYYLLYASGAGPYMTAQEIAAAKMYLALDPYVKPAIVTTWLVFIGMSFLHVMAKGLKYADGIRKGLIGEGSRYQKRRQGAVRLAGMFMTAVIAFGVGYTQWGFFADLLGPLVLGSGVGAAIAGSALGAVIAVRLSLSIIKFFQRAYNKSSNGRNLSELRSASTAKLNRIAKELGMENSLIQRYGFKSLRAWHLHWISGNTNVTLAHGTHLPQQDANGRPINSPYLKSHQYHYYGIVIGIALGILVASALLAAPITLPFAAPMIYLSATLIGISTGKSIGGLFTRYTSMSTSQTPAWLIASLVVGLSITFSVFSFGAPLIAVGAVAAVFGLITAGLAIKVVIEESRKKNKPSTRSENSAIVVENEKLQYNANLKALTEDLTNQEAILNYFAATHKLVHDEYQKNDAKLQRLSFLKELVKESINGYKKCWHDAGNLLATNDFLGSKWYLSKPIQLTATLIYGTLRTGLALSWAILPFRRLFDYGVRSYDGIKNSTSNVEKVFKTLGYLVGIIPVLLNPFHGTAYGDKKEKYEHKKAQNKKLMRNAEEAYLLYEKNKNTFSNNDGELTFSAEAGKGKLNKVFKEIQEIRQEQLDFRKKKLEEVNSNLECDTLVTGLFYSGIRSKTNKEYRAKAQCLRHKINLQENPKRATP
jgi:hypothetical protein